MRTVLVLAAARAACATDPTPPPSISENNASVTMTMPITFTEPTNPSTAFSFLSANDPSSATWALTQQEANFGTYWDHTIQLGFNYMPPDSRVDASKGASWMQGESRYDGGDGYMTEWHFSDRGTDDVEHRWISHTALWDGTRNDTVIGATNVIIADHKNQPVTTFWTNGALVGHSYTLAPDSLLHVWGGTAGVVTAVPAT